MKIKITLTLLILSSFYCDAQIIFQKTIGGSNTDYAYDAHKAPTGGYVFGGVSISFPTAGAVGSYVVKTNDNGDTIWTAGFKGTGGSCDFQYVNDLTPLADGGVVAVGGKSVCNDTTVGGNIVRLDANGNAIWAKYTTKYTDPYPVIQCNDGSIIVGGYETDGGYLAVKDAFLMKLDLATGDTLWSKRYGGAGDDWFYHIEQTPDNGYIAAGFTTSFGQGGRDIYLVKTDAAGNLQWSKVYGTSGYDCAFGHSVYRTSDGGYILAGQGDAGSQSAHGVFLMKTDALGNMSWAKYYDGIDGHGVRQTSDGGYVVTGRSSVGIQLIKTNSSGNVLWSKTYTGGINEKGLIMELATDGGFVVGGQGSFGGNTELYMIKTDSMGNSGCNESNAGVTSTSAPFITVNPASMVIQGGATMSYPLMLARGGSTNTLCTTVGIDEINKPDQLTVFPNPVTDIIHIKSLQTPGMITIYNSVGEIILLQKINLSDQQIDMSKQPAGIYIVRSQNIFFKIVKL